MAIMLVTGASRGIGRAFAERFKDTYEVVTVARTGAVTEQGDLTDGAFRKHLVEKYTPDVFVNNAGILDHQTGRRSSRGRISVPLPARQVSLPLFPDQVLGNSQRTLPKGWKLCAD